MNIAVLCYCASVWGSNHSFGKLLIISQHSTTLLGNITTRSNQTFPLRETYIRSQWKFDLHCIRLLLVMHKDCGRGASVMLTQTHCAGSKKHQLVSGMRNVCSTGVPYQRTSWSGYFCRDTLQVKFKKLRRTFHALQCNLIYRHNRVQEILVLNFTFIHSPFKTPAF